MQGRIARTFMVASLVATAASSAAAQNVQLTKEQTLRALDSLIADAERLSTSVSLGATERMTQITLRAQPGNTAGSESAWGAGWGDFFVGVGYQTRARFSSSPDGSGSFGFGLGHNRGIGGLEVGVHSASTFNQTPGRNGSVSVKLHRVVFETYGVAFGVENLVSWGGTDGGASSYAVVSHTQRIRNDPSWFLGSIAWNVGVGNSRFLPEADLFDGRTGGVNAFGSFGIRLASRGSLVADWTGQDLSAGLSLVPFHKSPIVVSLGVADLTRRAGNGPRAVIGMGAGFRVLDIL